MSEKGIPETAGERPRSITVVPEPTDTWGPAGTYGCACKSRDASNCALLRYGHNPGPDCQRCECMCHQWDDEDGN